MQPIQVVLVVDGPINSSQDEIIEKYKTDDRIPKLTILRLKNRSGLPEALNQGLSLCFAPWIARMDSDDICIPTRFEEQSKVIKLFQDVDVIGSWCAEFRNNPDSITGLKTPPETHTKILRALQWRNILVHPSIVVRKKALCAIGGYRPHYGDYADYELYVRLALSGARFHMIQRPLVLYRTSLAQRRRRTGLEYAKHEFAFRCFCYRSGFTSLATFLIITPIYCLFRLTPARLKEHLYLLVRSIPT
jgi:glycosyltransferase involved in cell wall biosynthesis